MKLQLKVDEFSIIGVGKGNRKAKLEILANKEDLFEMLDEISPKVLADYMAKRMKPEEHYEARLVNIIAGEGGEL